MLPACLFASPHHHSSLTAHRLLPGLPPVVAVHDQHEGDEAADQAHVRDLFTSVAGEFKTFEGTIQFDPETHTAVGDTEATALLKREYRKPYVHPAEA